MLVSSQQVIASFAEHCRGLPLVSFAGHSGTYDAIPAESAQIIIPKTGALVRSTGPAEVYELIAMPSPTDRLSRWEWHEY